MIIDMCTHISGKDRGRCDSILSRAAQPAPHTDGLIAFMRRSGIDCSVILPAAASARQVEQVNDASAQLSEQYGNEGLLSFGCMHLDYAGFAQELK